MDTVARIIFDVQNADAVRRSREEIEREAKAIRDLNGQLRAGAISQAQFDAAARASAQNIAGLRQQIEQAEAAARKLGSSGGGMGGRGANNLLQIGRLADDLQYVGEQGIRPVIGQIFEIAPAVGFAVLAIDTLVRHWDDFKVAIRDDSWLGDLKRQMGGVETSLEDVRDAAHAVLANLGGPAVGILEALGIDTRKALGGALGISDKVKAPVIAGEEGHARAKAAEEALADGRQKQVERDLQARAAAEKDPGRRTAMIREFNKAFKDAAGKGDEAAIALLQQSPAFAKQYAAAKTRGEKAKAGLPSDADFKENEDHYQKYLREQDQQAEQQKANEVKGRENIRKFEADRAKEAEKADKESRLDKFALGSRGIDEATAAKIAAVQHQMGLRSAVIGGADFGRSVQQGVGPNQDLGKQQVEHLKALAETDKQALAALLNIERNSRGGARAG
jgi:hypothetical protein